MFVFFTTGELTGMEDMSFTIESLVFIRRSSERDSTSGLMKIISVEIFTRPFPMEFNTVVVLFSS
jgi:hypothetical protein